MARRRMDVADSKEILVAWDAGENVSAIERRLGYSRPTIRKYIRAAERVGLRRGGERRAEADWEEVTAQALDRVAQQRAVGVVAQEVGAYHGYLAERVGTVRLSVLYQRLQQEQGLQASWGSFYRYVAAQWPLTAGAATATDDTIGGPTSRSGSASGLLLCGAVGGPSERSPATAVCLPDDALAQSA